MSGTTNLQVEKEKTSTLTSGNAPFPSQLKEKFQSIDSKYSTELSRWREQKDGLTLTDSQANQLASNELSEYYSAQLEKIENKHTTKQEKIDQSNISTQNKYYTQLDKAQGNYEEGKQDLRFDSIDKGWRVSSIYKNELSQIENEYGLNKSLINKERSEKLDNLSFQQNLLEQEKESALQSFNIAYAQKLSDKIEKIKKEFEKENSSALKETEGKIEDVKLSIGREKTAEILSYIRTFSKQDSINFINSNPELKDELGRDWYVALVNWVNKK